MSETLAGAIVTARVMRPGGTFIDIELHDDGDPAHGDLFPDDGTYGAIFDTFTIHSDDYLFLCLQACQHFSKFPVAEA